MGIALGKLAQEDPSFRVKTDEETGQTIISGMGELHLDILVDRMRANLVSRPILASLRWLIAKPFVITSRVEGKFVRQSVVVVSMVMFG